MINENIVIFEDTKVIMLKQSDKTDFIPCDEVRRVYCQKDVNRKFGYDIVWYLTILTTYYEGFELAYEDRARCESDCLEILRKIAIVKSNKAFDTNTDI